MAEPCKDNPMSNTERVKERITKILKEFDGGCPKGKNIITGCDTPFADCNKCAKDMILADPDILVKNKNQEPPQVEIDIHIWRDYLPDMAYEKCFQDMLKDNWVKVERKEA